MSILVNAPALSQADSFKRDVTSAAKLSKRQLVRGYKKVVKQVSQLSPKQVTDGVTVEDKVEWLGTDAAELFALEDATFNFLAAVLAGKDDALLADLTTLHASLPDVTPNPDGTVSIT